MMHIVRGMPIQQFLQLLKANKQQLFMWKWENKDTFFPKRSI